MSEENRITELLELKDVEVTQIQSLPQENLIFISVSRRKHKCLICGCESNTIHDYRTQRILDDLVPSLADLPEVLGIDEFKGYTNETKYHCILTDLQTGKPIDILLNRTEAMLTTHCRKYQNTGQLNHVKIIVIDMLRSYYTVLRQIFPNALILIDLFHMVRQVM